MTIIPEIEVRSTRDVLAAASVGDIITALHVDHSEVITRKPMEFFPVWSAQALANGEVHHGTGGSLHEALVECGVHAGSTATRVKELAEPSPVERMLETLAVYLAVADDSGRVHGAVLAAIVAARHGVAPADAVELVRSDSHDERYSAAVDELIGLIDTAVEITSPVPVLRRAAAWLDGLDHARVTGWIIREAFQKTSARSAGQAALDALAEVWNQTGGFNWTPSAVHSRAEIVSRMRDAADVIEMVESGVELDVAVAS